MYLYFPPTKIIHNGKASNPGSGSTSDEGLNAAMQCLGSVLKWPGRLGVSGGFKEACQMDSDQTWILNVFEVLGKGSSEWIGFNSFSFCGAVSKTVNFGHENYLCGCNDTEEIELLARLTFEWHTYRTSTTHKYQLLGLRGMSSAVKGIDAGDIVGLF
ncbi:hypothetical protein B0H13DRAFT_1881999 [Mycena leptocephala]|nr:hypothetical protein B0H13DRAFT_1881999 [Mycena leptocephala]